MKKISDHSPYWKENYLKLFLFRKEDTKDVSPFDWFVLSFVELLFGEELLEHISITSSYRDEKKGKMGHALTLSNLVPLGFFTNLFRQKIYQVLYYKYALHYILIKYEGDHTLKEDDELDLTGYKFVVRHSVLYQFIAFRRVYILFWTVFNIAIDLLIFFTIDLQAAIISALSIELLRRILKW